METLFVKKGALLLLYFVVFAYLLWLWYIFKYIQTKHFYNNIKYGIEFTNKCFVIILKDTLMIIITSYLFDVTFWNGKNDIWFVICVFSPSFEWNDFINEKHFSSMEKYDNIWGWKSCINPIQINFGPLCIVLMIQPVLLRRKNSYIRLFTLNCSFDCTRTPLEAKIVQVTPRKKIWKEKGEGKYHAHPWFTRSM